MTNLEKLTFPINCISYYASSKSAIDNKDSYCYWFRGKYIKIISNKPFARGDMLTITSINHTQNGIIIETTVNTGEYIQYPVLSFVSTRLVYNKYSDFDFTTTQGVKILDTVEQVIDENYSVCFIVLFSESGLIKASDKNMKNYFDINLTLNWNK